MRPVDFRIADDRAVLQHVFEIDEIAVMHVLRKIVGVVKVDDAFGVRFCDIFIEQKAPRDVFAHFSGHIVALDADDCRIFIRVFLFDFFVVFVEQA